MLFHADATHKIWQARFVAILIILLSVGANNATASVLNDLDQLVKVIGHTIDRLESGITLDQPNESDFAEIAGLQLELSALAVGRADLLEEDYYRLALSLIARHFAKYDLASNLLKLELASQKLPAAKHWLLKEIADLDELIASSKKQSLSQLKPSCDYKLILQDLKRIFARSGIR